MYITFPFTMRSIYLALICSFASAALLPSRQNAVCSQIAGNITGDVYYSLSINYINDTEHYMSSSSETPLCVVEVASPQDVSNVLKIVAATRTPFAVKSGGHASNPGFSSTTGVFISLVRLNQITFSEDKSTIEIGLGNVIQLPSARLRAGQILTSYQVWTDVYSALDGSGYNVVGGRVPGPGTGGFSLGGGYSWLSEYV